MTQPYASRTTGPHDDQPSGTPRDASGTSRDSQRYAKQTGPTDTPTDRPTTRLGLADQTTVRARDDQPIGVVVTRTTLDTSQTFHLWLADNPEQCDDVTTLPQLAALILCGRDGHLTIGERLNITTDRATVTCPACLEWLHA